jgi:hypothetical protein
MPPAQDVRGNTKRHDVDNPSEWTLCIMSLFYCYDYVCSGIIFLATLGIHTPNYAA